MEETSIRVFKFSSKDCQPCKQLSKQLQSIETEILTVSYDVYENQQLARSFGIRSVPTLIAVREDGVEVHRMTGTTTQEQLQEWYDYLSE